MRKTTSSPPIVRAGVGIPALAILSQGLCRTMKMMNKGLESIHGLGWAEKKSQINCETGTTYCDGHM